MTNTALHNHPLPEGTVLLSPTGIMAEIINTTPHCYYMTDNDKFRLVFHHQVDKWTVIEMAEEITS